VGDLVLVDRVDPKFPTEALRNGIQSGSVTVKFTVQPDGSVSGLSVTDAKPRRGIFDQAALRAVARWKFKPIVAPKDSVITLDFNTEGGG
jgi:protein TonB